MKRIFSIILAAAFVAALIPNVIFGSNETEPKELPAANCEQFYKECIATYEREDVSVALTDGEIPIGMDLLAVDEVEDDKHITAVYLAGTPQITGEYVFGAEFTSEQNTSSEATESIKDNAKYSLKVQNPPMVLPDALWGQDYKECLYAANVNPKDVKAEKTDGYMTDDFKIEIEPAEHDENDDYVPARFYLVGKPAMHSPDGASYSCTFTVTFTSSVMRTYERTYTVYVGTGKYTDLKSCKTGEDLSLELMQIQKDECLVYDADTIPEGLELVTEPLENTNNQIVYLKGKAQTAGFYHFCIGVNKLPSSSETTGEEVAYFSFRLDVIDDGIRPVTGYAGEYYYDHIYSFTLDGTPEIVVTPKGDGLPEGMECIAEGLSTDDSYINIALFGTPEKAGFYDIELDIRIKDADEPITVLSFAFNVLPHYTGLSYRNLLYFTEYANRETLLICDKSGAHIDSDSIKMRGSQQLGLGLYVDERDDQITIELGGRNAESNPYKYIFNLEYYVEGCGFVRKTFSVYVIVKDFDLGTFTVGEAQDYTIPYNVLFENAKSIEIIRDCDGTKLTLNPKDGRAEITFSLGTYDREGENNMIVRLNYEDEEKTDALINLRFKVKAKHYGDANLDGKVNTGDSTLILKYCADMVELNEEQLHYADANHDGKVNTGDATRILRYAAGMEGHPDNDAD